MGSEGRDRALEDFNEILNLLTALFAIITNNGINTFGSYNDVLRYMLDDQSTQKQTLIIGCMMTMNCMQCR